MTMAEILTAMPGARRALFRKYHIGGCASCGFDPGETLAGVCARNGGLDVGEVLAALEAAREEDAKLEIAPADLKALLTSGGARVVDIRSREEFDAARIAGSELFTQDLMRELMERGERGDKNVRLVFVDHRGERSADAAAYFIGHGWTSVCCLRGGIDAWSVEVDPSVPRYSLE